MIKFWFPTLIDYKILDSFKDANSYLEQKALKIQEHANSTSRVDWSCDTYNSLGFYNYLEDNDKTINLFVLECKKHIIDFAKEFGVNKGVEALECTDFWFNISQYGNYQEFHRHANSHFSIVYYVRAPERSGNIVFQSFETNTDMFTLPIETVTDASCKTCFYEPKESALLIFRSNLVHMVQKNLSNNNRISISANFKFN